MRINDLNKQNIFATRLNPIKTAPNRLGEELFLVPGGWAEGSGWRDSLRWYNWG